ncbi:MAG: hypothetical protein ACREFY_00240, partial [Acetobacteraceae bacterium]
MQGLMRFIIEFVIFRVYDFIQFLRDFWQVCIRRLHKVVLRERTGDLAPPADVSRAAIVAIYPSEASLPFTINLLRSLVTAGCYVLLISTRRLSDTASAQLLQHCHYLIERAAVGRDFGSYKLGLQWLEGAPERFRTVDTLVLANDSLF